MKTISFAHILRTVLIFCAIFGVARADVDDFIVNDDAGTVVQTNPRIAVSANGGFVIAWVDRRSGANDIYVQRFDADANPISINKRANDDVVSAWQAEPSLACDYSGNYWLVWKDYRNGVYPFDADVYFQRYDSTLNKLGVNRDLTLEPPDSLKETPDIAVSPTGAVVVVWADYRNSNWDIYGQLINSDGSLSGSNFLINTDGSGAQQHAPRVAYSEDGWFIVTWYDNRLGDDDIFVQRFDSLANPLSGNTKVNSNLDETRQAFPDVAADAAGRFTVVWVDWRNGRYPANPDIYSRTFNTSMTPQNSDTKINTDGTLRAQREPTIAADRQGNVAIVWSDSIGSSFDIVGQMIDADGVVRETNFQANSFFDSAQIQADVALDGRYRYLTWVDKRNGNFDIYAAIQQYNDPTLSAAPLHLSFEMDENGALPSAKTIALDHVGYNPISFDVESDVAWLGITPSSGTSPDTIEVSVSDSTLAPGTYLANISIIDTDNNDSSLTVPVTLTVNSVLTPSAADTIQIGSIAVGKSSVGSVLIDARFDSDVSEFYLPLRYDTSVLAFDSAVGDPSLPVGYDLLFEVDSIAGEATLSVIYDSLSGPLPTGSQTLAEVFFTTKDIDYRMPLDTAYNDTLNCRIVDTSGTILAPVVLAGEIVVGTPTGVNDDFDADLPQSVLLLQNYPNPFNLATTIRFSLANADHVRLTVHNVLGQEVAVLADRSYPAGEFEIVWDGRSRYGDVVSSGVYFYRLANRQGSIVRKMLLLK